VLTEEAALESRALLEPNVVVDPTGAQVPAGELAMDRNDVAHAAPGDPRTTDRRTAG
jgi:hypothetical protein